MAREFGVDGGPDRYELTLALWAPKHKNTQKVTFFVFIIDQADCLEYEMQVDSIQAFDGSGEHWNIEGMASPIKALNPGSGVYEAFVEQSPDLVGILERKPRRVHLFYDIKDKDGWIKFFL